nr:hypothetical protein [Tanacetum cinerariifolium]
MDATIDQQMVMDEALVPHAKRLRIGRSNFCLLSDIKSKESTLQLVYDVLRLTLFFNAFLVTIDVLEIYMQEFWATATVHHYSIRFKMDNKKHIVNLESFRDMLHIWPRLPGQSFVKPPFEEEILAFLCFLRHNAVIRKLIDVNINKLHQPWRSFTAIIKMWMTTCRKSLSIRLNTKIQRKKSNEMYYLMWEDFVYQVEHKDTKKSNEMYYPRGSDVPTDESEEDISWKSTDDEGNVDEGNDGDDNDNDNGDDGEEGDGDNDGEEGNDDDDDQEDEGVDDEDDEKKGNDDEQASNKEEFIHQSLTTHAKEETRDKESFGRIPKTPKNSDDEGNGEENLGTNVGSEEGNNEEEEEDELYRDANINQGRGIQTTQEFKDSHVTLTPSDRLRDDAQKENDKFLKIIDENMQKIIKEQVKEQVKVQVSRILPKIKQTMNEQLEAEVLTRSSNSSKTSYDVAIDLSAMELKKILIKKIEGNKSIHQTNEQRKSLMM